MPSNIIAEIVGENTVQVTDVETGHFLFEIFHAPFEFPDSDRRTIIWDVAVSPNGKYIATAGRDTTARLWNGRTGELIRVVTAMNGRGDTSNHAHEGGYMWSVAFSPDSRFLATGGYYGHIRLWDVKTQELLVDVGQFDVTDSRNVVYYFVIQFAEDGKSILAHERDAGEVKEFPLSEQWRPHHL